MQTTIKNISNATKNLEKSFAFNATKIWAPIGLFPGTLRCYISKICCPIALKLSHVLENMCTYLIYVLKLGRYYVYFNS